MKNFLLIYKVLILVYYHLRDTHKSFGLQMTTSHSYVMILQQLVCSRLSCLVSFACASRYVFLLFEIAAVSKSPIQMQFAAGPGLSSRQTQMRRHGTNRKTVRDRISIFWCLACFWKSTLHFPSRWGAEVTGGMVTCSHSKERVHVVQI